MISQDEVAACAAFAMDEEVEEQFYLDRFANILVHA
jgi:hypothetical protein